MDAGLTDVLINSGVAGAFCIFAVVVVREFVKYLSAQSEAWQKYLASEQANRADQTKQWSEALSGLTVEINALRSNIEEHDDWVKDNLARTSTRSRSRQS